MRLAARGIARSATVLVLLVSASPPAAAQRDLASRVAQVRDGAVRFTYRARDGVCGDGETLSVRHEDNEYWESDCEKGPVRLVLIRERGRTVKVKSFVGGRWRAAESVTDLGTVAAPEAARYLLSLVRDGAPAVSRAAILPAQLADSVVLWPDLLEIARDDVMPHGTRKAAVFWVGQAASEKAVEGLEGLANANDAEMDLREHAVFALSQQPGGDAVPALIRLATEHSEPRIRRRALFWLGQRDDPRVLELFERILSGGMS